MKLYSGKRIGQSRQELAAAVTFSLFLHVIFFLAAVLIFFTVKTRVYVPPVYSVKLVNEPAEAPVLPAAPAAPVPRAPLPKQELKKQTVLKHQAKRPAANPSAAEKKNALPDLAAQKKTPEAAEQGRPAEQSQPAPRSPGEAAASGGRTEGVAVATPQQDFKYGWYLDRVRSKIGQHWNPPPDAAEAQARIIFSINRSGWVGEVNLDPDQSLGTFGFKQAAVRAIRASNPFPPLPDEFSRQTLEFTVDLMAVD